MEMCPEFHVTNYLMLMIFDMTFIEVQHASLHIYFCVHCIMELETFGDREGMVYVDK